MTHKNAYELLTPHQARVVEQRLTEAASRACPVVVSLSGSHAYGFPAPDSDVDVKAIHIDPTARLLGLQPTPTSYNHVGTFDGVTIDYTSNEVGGVLRAILQGNGNFIERVLGGQVLAGSTVLDEMQDVVQRALSRRVRAHYEGFARSLIRQMTSAEQGKRTKFVLHAMRTFLTGAHLLGTGKFVGDLPTLLPLYGFADVLTTVEERRRGEEGTATLESDNWLPRAFDLLDTATEKSPLPEAPKNEAEVEAWLVSTRTQMM